MEPERPVTHLENSMVSELIERGIRSTKSLFEPLLDSNRTLGVTRPVISSIASGLAFGVVTQVRPDAVVAFGRFDLRIWSACAEQVLCS
jgi:hypothetical protein